MPGYPRPAPAFRWYSWWWPMGLMHAEEDDDAVLEAEDEAIRAAAAGETSTDLFTLPDSLAHLMSVDDAGTTEVHPEPAD